MQRASSSFGVFLSTGATAVSYFTMNDWAVLIGIMSTLGLSLMNYKGRKQQKIKTAHEVEKIKLEQKKIRLENKKLQLENEKLQLENEVLRIAKRDQSEG